MITVLVTGSRDWTDEATIRHELQCIQDDNLNCKLVHGAARGADSIAAKIASEMGWLIEAYPADWQKHGKKAGPIRNQVMLDLGMPDMVLAFPLPQSIGTFDMIRRAENAGVPVRVVGQPAEDGK